MKIRNVEQIEDLKNRGVEPLYSIWIVHEEMDDNTYDVSVWDEWENERDDSLEKSRFETLQHAEEALRRIVLENPTITFVRLPNVKH